MIGAKRIREKLGPRYGEMVEDLRRIVSIDSPTFPGAGAAKVAAHFEERYRAIGGDVDRVPGTGGAGDHLTVRFRGARPEKPKVFLIGHCDTVFPEGKEVGRRPEEGPAFIQATGLLPPPREPLHAVVSGRFKLIRGMESGEVELGISSVDRLHLDHVRPHVSQHPPARRTGHDVRELDHPKACQWSAPIW